MNIEVDELMRYRDLFVEARDQTAVNVEKEKERVVRMKDHIAKLQKEADEVDSNNVIGDSQIRAPEEDIRHLTMEYDSGREVPTIDLTETGQKEVEFHKRLERYEEERAKRQ